MIWLLIGIVIGVIIVVMLFPIIICARSSRLEGTTNGSLSISWLIFTIQYELKDNQTDILILGHTLSHHQYNEKKSENKDKNKNKVKKGKNKDVEKSVKSRSFPPVQDLTPMIRPMIRLIRDLLSLFKNQRFKLDIIYGLEDPADTGVLTGYLHALTGQYDFSFTPDFTQPVLDWDLDIATAFTPFMIIPPIIRFATNPRVLRSGWRIIRS